MRCAKYLQIFFCVDGAHCSRLRAGAQRVPMCLKNKLILRLCELVEGVEIKMCRHKKSYLSKAESAATDALAWHLKSKSEGL